MEQDKQGKISRRDFIRLAGITTAGAFVAGCRRTFIYLDGTPTSAATPEPEIATTVPTVAPEATVNRTIVEPTAPPTDAPTQVPVTDTAEPTSSPEAERANRIKYGFNTHMSANPAPGENLTIDAFRQDVDRMASMGMDAIRFNVWEWELNNLGVYDEAIDYAKNRGLEVHLVTNVPGLSKNGENLEADLLRTRAFYEDMAGRWAGKVDVWQIFNEVDDHHYANYRKIDADVPYMNNLGELVIAANAVIKAMDPNAKTTVNVSMWVGADPWIGADSPRLEEVGIFDAACGFEPGSAIDQACQTIDFISLDPYLDTNEEAIRRFPEVIAYFARRYQKPVIIAELGLPTGDGRFTEEDQGEFTARAIDAMQGGLVRPHAILLYEFRDEALNGPAEGSFGFNRADGTPKPGFDDVIDAMAVDFDRN